MSIPTLQNEDTRCGRDVARNWRNPGGARSGRLGPQYPHAVRVALLRLPLRRMRCVLRCCGMVEPLGSAREFGLPVVRRLFDDCNWSAGAWTEISLMAIDQAYSP